MAAFDVAGTTVKDDGLVIAAFTQAFAATQGSRWSSMQFEWTQYARDTMGRSKIAVFRELLGDDAEAERANQAFEKAYLSLVQEVGIEEIPGSTELFNQLQKMQIPIVLTTGFSRETLDVIISSLGWIDVINFSVTPHEAGGGRPSPAMLIRAAKHCAVTDPAQTLVVGDTASDMEAAVAFGSLQRVGVLSGAHQEKTLRETGATLVVHSVASLSLPI